MLSPAIPGKSVIDLTLLGYRMLIAFAMIRTHGWKKLVDFEGTITHIPDPLGIGGLASAFVAVGVNVVLAGFVAIGLLTRLSALGILTLTISGFFLVHFQDPWPIKDVPLMYSIAFALVLIMGPGKYSMDHRLIKN